MIGYVTFNVKYYIFYKKNRVIVSVSDDLIIEVLHSISSALSYINFQQGTSV